MNELLEKALESAFCQSVMEKINSDANLESLKDVFNGVGIKDFHNINDFLLAVATALDVSKDDSNVNLKKVCDAFNTHCNTHYLDELKIETFSLDDIMVNLADELDDRQNRIEELEGKLDDIANIASY